MAWSPARTGLLVSLTATLALCGCVDMFTGPPAGATPWRGTTTAGNPAYPECGAFAFQLGQYAPPAYLWNTVSGRAWPAAVPASEVDKWRTGFTQWWLEGYVSEANFVEFETKMQQPVYFGARPYSVWRGTIADDRMVMTESGSPCNREVVLTRG